MKAAADAPVGSLFPTVSTIPSNALRFEVHWPKKMRLGPHGVTVWDSSGQPVRKAFPRIQWDEPMRVLFLEPKGLRMGERYTLRVEGTLTADGVLTQSLSHEFEVSAPDKLPPMGERVRVTGSPMPGTKAPLSVSFSEPVWLSSLEALSVVSKGKLVRGRWSLEPGMAEATFMPEHPWTKELVWVSIAAGVRDLANNEMVRRPTGPLVPSKPVAP